ncbi:hypothetical protein [Thiomicrorhabdus sp.]|uniref:hypothetical protein n=1 Tax=Thiomicrorhabdus sp. TaxID=2039724 RepID=UPI002AA8EB8E|nr:hypothetical protein [Thiomicrorhabdus sp.]
MLLEALFFEFEISKIKMTKPCGLLTWLIIQTNLEQNFKLALSDRTINRHYQRQKDLANE